MPAPARNPKAVLIYASSEADSNLYYITRFLVGDPVVYLEVDGRKLLLVGELELGRARLQARVDEVISAGPYENRLREGGAQPRPVDLIELLLREIGVSGLEVPASFPLGLADRLRAKGFAMEVREDPFFPQRVAKTAEEIELIAQAQRITEEAMGHAVGMLAEARIEGDRLRYRSEILTAEMVQIAVRRFLLDRGYLAADVIVAGGDQGCDPHIRGAGPLPAHRTIILDIYPRSLASRYWGDMTRTVVRGRASDEVRKLHADVADAHRLVVSLLRPGVEGMDVHQAVVDHFKSRGHETGEKDGKMQGFFHGTGHGVGLDLHEAPRIGKIKSPIEAGHVVTVEPGLYYPGVGAVRIEDLVVVEASGARNFNVFPKVLEV